MNLLVKGGEVVTHERRFHADVYCEEGTIKKIGERLPAPAGCRVIDASGKYVFPGFIDPHVHVYLPASGTYAADTYETASRAAVLGGTTCFMDFVLPEPGESPLSAWDTWQSKSEGQSCCDYSYHMGVTRFDETIARDLREIVRRGITSFKIHLAYKGILGISDREMFETLGLARDLGVITLCHCENEDAIELRRRQLVGAGHREMKWHYHSRPPIVEADGTHHFLAFAELQNAPAYVAHLSCVEALEVAVKSRQHGAAVWIETLIQFLLLDKRLAEQAGLEGAKYLMSPPLRDAANHETLWFALREGVIDTVATDHAPFNLHGQKDKGVESFTSVPNGLPGIQDRVNLLYSYGVVPGKIDLEHFVACASTQPARIFGMYPRKGLVAVDSDADLVVFDPSYETIIRADEHAMNVDYNAFEGWTVKGRAEAVTVRGEVVVDAGEFCGRPGHGRFVPRTSSCAFEDLL